MALRRKYFLSCCDYKEISFSLEYISRMFIRGAEKSNRDCNALPPLPQLYQDMATQSLHHDGTAITFQSWNHKIIGESGWKEP